LPLPAYIEKVTVRASGDRGQGQGSEFGGQRLRFRGRGLGVRGQELRFMVWGLVYGSGCRV
jgi:hypothetical protein